MNVVRLAACAVLLSILSGLGSAAWKLPEAVSHRVALQRGGKYEAYLREGTTRPEQTRADYYSFAQSHVANQQRGVLPWGDPLADSAMTLLQLPIPPGLSHPFLVSAGVSLFAFGVAAAAGWISCERLMTPNYAANLRRHRKRLTVATRTVFAVTVPFVLSMLLITAGLGGVYSALSPFFLTFHADHDSVAWALIGVLLSGCVAMLPLIRRQYRREVERCIGSGERRCIACNYELLDSIADVCSECGRPQLRTLYPPTRRLSFLRHLPVVGALVFVVALVCLQSGAFQAWSGRIRMNREFPGVDFSGAFTRVLRLPIDSLTIVETNSFPPRWAIRVSTDEGVSSRTGYRKRSLLCLAAHASVWDSAGKRMVPATCENLMSSDEAYVTGGPIHGSDVSGWIGTEPFFAFVDDGPAPESQFVTMYFFKPLRMHSIQRLARATAQDEFACALEGVDVSGFPIATERLNILRPPCRLRDAPRLPPPTR